MNSRFWAWLAALLLAVAVNLANAQDESPEQVAEAYGAALKTSGMSGATEFMHPDELERFRASLAPVLAIEPGLGEEVRKGIFGPEMTAASMSAMSAETFMKGCLGFADKQMKATNTELVSMEIIGSVPEGEITHLVTRGEVRAGAMTLTSMEVMSLKHYGKTWRLLLSGKIEGMAEMIKAQIQAHAPPAAAPQKNPE
ncbi:hypothetical protein C7S18_04595 [Ahniella affigens]|uniref:SnoaL-like domain-containing protein n=1 Tax=Ahniella affigens TaxID=2021234 RepID=A0A2P1PNU9_9GAMM|nr:hypothetical protein [Ahniella affigens]AVP96520.1 hypothetical protein C7S18_04595 [Ahniella affigens]